MPGQGRGVRSCGAEARLLSRGAGLGVHRSFRGFVGISGVMPTAYVGFAAVCRPRAPCVGVVGTVGGCFRCGRLTGGFDFRAKQACFHRESFTSRSQRMHSGRGIACAIGILLSHEPILLRAACASGSRLMLLGGRRPVAWRLLDSIFECEDPFSHLPPEIFRRWQFFPGVEALNKLLVGGGLDDHRSESDSQPRSARQACCVSSCSRCARDGAGRSWTSAPGHGGSPAPA
jgi:hypothetical protein